MVVGVEFRRKGLAGEKGRAKECNVEIRLVKGALAFVGAPASSMRYMVLAAGVNVASLLHASTPCRGSSQLVPCTPAPFPFSLLHIFFCPLQLLA